MPADLETVKITPTIANDGAGISEAEAVSAFAGLLDDTPPEEAPAKAAEPEGDADTDEAAEERAEDEKSDAEDEDKASDDEEAGAEDGADEDGEGDDEPQSVRVRLSDGSEADVTIDELKSGYLRNADYTRKTQSLAEERKALQSVADTAKQEREALQQTMGMLAGYAEQMVMGGYTKEDLARLRQQDPQQYLLAKEEIDGRTRQLQTLRRQQALLTERSRQEAEERHGKDLAKGRERVLDLIPAWRDPSVAAQGKQQVANVLRGEGYSDQELAMLTDPRAVKMLNELHELRQFKEAVESRKAKAKAKVQAAPKMQPAKAEPPKGRQATNQQQADANRKRLKRRGDIDSAAAVFADTL